MDFQKVLMASAGQGGGQAFLPTSLSPYGYFDAELTSSLTLAVAAVTTWTDPVTGLAPTQATALNKPTYLATALNNRPGVTGGATAQLLSPGNTPFPSNTYEVWALVKINSLAADTSGRYFMQQGTTPAAVSIGRFGGGGTNHVDIVRGANDANSSVDVSGIHVWRAVFTTSNYRADIDGVAGTPVSNGTAFGAAKFSLFAQVAGTNNSIDTINYLGIFPILTAGQASQMYSYLNARGGL